MGSRCDSLPSTCPACAHIHRLQNVWPVQLLSRPLSPVVDDLETFSASTYANLTSLLASTTPAASAYKGETYYPHVQTGVAALHNTGYLGEGVKVRFVFLSRLILR
jgi:hypothetical protein